MKKSLCSTLLLICFSILIALAGCSSNEEKASSKPKQKQKNEQEHAMGDDHTAADIAETTKGADTLPSFLSTKPEQMQKIYQMAGEDHELLEWIPCYCGCGESVDHKSNKNCFVREVKNSGEIVWDSHATICANCLEIALQSVSLKKNGMSTLEIRQYIDKQYKEGYAKPTPTPMPSA
ncbi:PCYCGC motif-containing (lipo)protein [Bacillus sp. DX4.1]|uniref:PCYCGC motif-containing (lipo)protein n=1 Tax=Bacillus sp. DX4.1 TaxID=3055867 RepID=UPI0025A2B31E|nr:PCYCGC motif-containing (lipo)protein [Bacillus sp. DX4.1]MDM5188077.1 PCYCGC motif-containing (lipo)protein [Bacillus sp. DX4.1]